MGAVDDTNQPLLNIQFELNTKIPYYALVSGIGGLQWKCHLADKIAVTINDKDSEAVKEILKNIERNGLKSVIHKAGEYCTRIHVLWEVDLEEIPVH